MSAYKPFRAQTFHYFARPHQAPLRTPIPAPQAWKAHTVGPAASWTERLSEDEIAAFERALSTAMGSGRSMADWTRDDLPLPTLASRFSAWREQIARGRGFVVLRGVPVDRWPREQSEAFFWGLGLHLGEPGAQSPQGDLLGNVRDDGAKDNVRLYRTTQHIRYHCDAADVVGLLCLQTPAEGGESRIASSIAIYNQVLAERPDLIDTLYRPWHLDTHGEGGIPYFPVVPAAASEGQLRLFYHSDYFRSVADLPGAAPLDDSVLELLDRFDALADDPAYFISMQFERGDIQLLSNHTIVHARTTYRDDPDTGRVRHLLRLWLSLAESGSFARWMRTKWALIQLLGRLARLRLG